MKFNLLISDRTSSLLSSVRCTNDCSHFCFWWKFFVKISHNIFRISNFTEQLIHSVGWRVSTCVVIKNSQNIPFFLYDVTSLHPQSTNIPSSTCVKNDPTNPIFYKARPSVKWKIPSSGRNRPPAIITHIMRWTFDKLSKWPELIIRHDNEESLPVPFTSFHPSTFP